MGQRGRERWQIGRKGMRVFGYVVTGFLEYGSWYGRGSGTVLGDSGFLFVRDPK